MNEKQFYALHHERICGMWYHPYCTKKGIVFEHRLYVEGTIGRYLIPREVVHHHYNMDGSATLVLCPNQGYHKLLHIRELALRMCGNANWRKCRYCEQYDDPKNMSNTYDIYYHKECRNKYHREYKTSSAL